MSPILICKEKEKKKKMEIIFLHLTRSCDSKKNELNLGSGAENQIKAKIAHLCPRGRPRCAQGQGHGGAELTNFSRHLSHLCREDEDWGKVARERGEKKIALMLLLMNVAVETRDPYRFIKIRIKRASVYSLAKGLENLSMF